MSLLFLFSQASFAASKYRVTDLGNIGENESWANGLNERGQVFGEYGGTYPNSSSDSRGFYWSKETGMIDLGTLGGDMTWPIDINEHGQITGVSDDSDAKERGFFWSMESGIKNIGTLGGDSCYPWYVTFAESINDSGKIVGRAIDESCVFHAIAWSEADGLVEIDPIGSYAKNINNEGWIVGKSIGGSIWIPENGTYNMIRLEYPYISCDRINNMGQALCGPSIWSLENGLIDIEGPSGEPIWGYYLNDLGQVTGHLTIENSDGLLEKSIFIWSKEKGFKDLGNLGGEGIWIAYMNNRGEIVGEGLSPNGKLHGFFANETHGVQDLNNLIGPNTGWEISSALGINEKGQIAGQVKIDVDDDGFFDEAHACLLTPILPIQIDIMPDSLDNSVNINDHGVIPVAILGTADFDVALVDPSTCSLQGMSVKMAGKSKLLCDYTDVNGDGYDDLLLKIEDSDGNFEVGQAIATLTGELFDGTPIEGSDFIRIVP